MEPSIYKPGAYKSPGIYKGAGGIYNGCGVYKMGADFPKYVTGPIVDNVQYKAVQINNLAWSYPLKYHTSTFFYPNNDTQNEDLGLLYQLKIAYDEIRPLLNNGWRIPVKADLENLISFVDDPKKLISKDYGGNNYYGLNCELEGYRSSESVFRRFGEMSFFWSTTSSLDVPGDSFNLLVSPTRLELDTGSGTINILYNTALSVRLCKDL